MTISGKFSILKDFLWSGTIWMLGVVNTTLSAVLKTKNPIWKRVEVRFICNKPIWKKKHFLYKPFFKQLPHVIWCINFFHFNFSINVTMCQEINQGIFDFRNGILMAKCFFLKSVHYLNMELVWEFWKSETNRDIKKSY